MLTRARVPAVYVVLAAASTLALLSIEFPAVRLACATLLLYLLPGFLAVEALFPDLSLDLLQKSLLAAALGYAAAVVSALMTGYLVGRLSFTAVLAAHNLLIIVLAIVSYWRAGRITPSPATAPGYGVVNMPLRGTMNHENGVEALAGKTSEVSETSEVWSGSIFRGDTPWFALAVLGIGAFGAFFRFFGLGYSDLLWDEAYVLWRVVATTTEGPTALFYHHNPPAQVLIHAAFGLLTGHLDEFSVRFPFALAGMLSVAAICLVGRDMFNEGAGLVAGALFAINGFTIGLARVLEYQSFLLLIVTICLWTSYRFYRSGTGAWLILSAILAAAGLLGHYEAGFVLPGLLYLLWVKWSRERESLGARYATLAVAVLLFLAIVSLHYVPYVLSSNLARTTSHLTQVVGEHPPYNNLDWLLRSYLFFNPVYYVGLVAFLLAVALMAPIRSLSPRGGAYALLAGGVVAVALAIYSWGRPFDWSLPLSVALFALLVTSPGATVAYRTALIWLATPFFTYTYLISTPAVHYYLLSIGGVLLAAMGFTSLLAAIQRIGESVRGMVGLWAVLPLQGAVMALLSALYLLSGYGAYLLFARYDLEYLITYPRHQNALFRVDTELREEILGWIYGFPFREGWQTVSHLLRAGFLRGDWGSNARGRLVEWYTMGRLRNDYCYPRYYFVLEVFPSSPEKIPYGIIEQDYALTGRIWVNDELRMRIYTLAPDREGVPPVRDFHEPASYDTYTSWETLNPPHEITGNANANLGNKMRLVGYQVDNWETRPGGTLVVTLFWQAMQPMTERYKVFLHVEDERIWGQHDSEPRCGLRPTADWAVGDTVLDRHLVPLNPQTPEGEHPLLVGLYDPATGQRLAVLDEQGAVRGDSVVLGKVVVQAANSAISPKAGE
jgi:4-amino-4-deoxy-L-arabinose transferase-like glycosyltransferase